MDSPRKFLLKTISGGKITFLNCVWSRCIDADAAAIDASDAATDALADTNAASDAENAAYVDADVANDPDDFADADTYANDDADVTASILIKMMIW